MLTIDKITEIFCLVDDFCIDFNKAKQGRVLNENVSKKQRNRAFKMSDSEVITIMFHAGCYRNLKHFYVKLCPKASNKRVSTNCFL